MTHWFIYTSTVMRYQVKLSLQNQAKNKEKKSKLFKTCPCCHLTFNQKCVVFYFILFFGFQENSESNWTIMKACCFAKTKKKKSIRCCRRGHNLFLFHPYEIQKRKKTNKPQSAFPLQFEANDRKGGPYVYRMKKQVVLVPHGRW